MSSQTDDLKGRVKEAAGDLTDNDDLRQEGRTDQAGAKVKEFAEDAKNAVAKGVDKVKDALKSDN